MEFDSRELLVMLATNDPAAAAAIRSLANRLYALAESLEAKSQDSPFTSPGGMTDRVRMKVQGPDGKTKSETDTNPSGK